MLNPQTYSHPEELGTGIEDDDGTNLDSEKELSLEPKLEIAITKENSTNQNTIHKPAIYRIIRRENDLFEKMRDLEVKTWKNIAHCEQYHPLECRDAFSTAGNSYTKLRSSLMSIQWIRYVLKSTFQKTVTAQQTG
ncbi:hypothetical protein TNCV_4298201 [Trichonephila clavipes]|nr:hypothetical protein TNCV_4298201 [Trichonephila clavipes]